MNFILDHSKVLPITNQTSAESNAISERISDIFSAETMQRDFAYFGAGALV